MYVFADYVKDYKNCRRSLELIKKILNCGTSQNLFYPYAIKKLRESLIDLFSKPELSAVCRDCKGDCCVTDNFKLAPFELFCFVIDNPEFELPEPDWQFLEEELKLKKIPINNHCLFLSSRGCLLKEQRPIICLRFYDCTLGFKSDSLADRLNKILSEEERENIFTLLTVNYSEAIKDFCRQLVENSGMPGNSSLAVCIKGDFIYSHIGYRACFGTLAKFFDICKNKSP